MYTTFNESVQGLETGSAVKFRGVPVGRVTGIRISKHSLDVQVDMELHEGGLPFESRNEVCRFLQGRVEQGARCRLELSGITGLKYIEIDFFGEPGPVDGVSAEVPPNDAFYIPSEPSLLAGVTANLSYTLARIATIDFEKIGGDISLLVESLNAYIGDDRLNTIMEELVTSSERLNATLAGMQEFTAQLTEDLAALELAEVGREFRAVLAGYERVPEEISRVAGNVSTTLEHIRKAVDQALASLDEMQLADTSRGTREAVADMRRDLGRTLGRLDHTLAAFAALADMLDEDPSALIRGKDRPQVRMGQQ